MIGISQSYTAHPQTIEQKLIQKVQNNVYYRDGKKNTIIFDTDFVYAVIVVAFCLFNQANTSLNVFVAHPSRLHRRGGKEGGGEGSTAHNFVTQ